MRWLLAILLLVPSSALAADIEKYLAAGDKLARQQLWYDALAEYEKAVTLAPDDARAWSALALAELATHDYRAAREHAYRAIKTAREPRHLAAAFYNLGRAYEELDELALAVASYAHSLALRPGNPSVLAALARARATLRDPLLGFAGKCARQLASEEGWTDSESGCEAVDVPDLAPLRVVAVSPSFFPQIRDYSYVLLDGSRGVREIGKRYWDMRPGDEELGGSEELEFGAVRRTAKILALDLTEVSQSRNSDDEERTTFVLYCRLSPVSCPLRLPLRGPGWELVHHLSPAGITVSLRSGKPDAGIRAALGTHKL